MHVLRAYLWIVRISRDPVFRWANLVLVLVAINAMLLLGAAWLLGEQVLGKSVLETTYDTLLNLGTDFVSLFFVVLALEVIARLVAPEGEQAAFGEGGGK